MADIPTYSVKHTNGDKVFSLDGQITFTALNDFSVTISGETLFKLLKKEFKTKPSEQTVLMSH